MRKILSIILAITMVMSCMSTVVFGAEADVAKIGDTEYATFADALAEAKDGETITLIADCVNLEGTINKKVIIDLGGKTVTDAYIIVTKEVEIKNGDIVNAEEPYPLVVNKGHLTINDVDIKASKSDRAIWLRDSYSATAPSTLTFNSGSILATKGENNTKSSIAAVYTDKNTQVNINGGTITVDTPGSKAYGIYGNYENANVTMTGGKVSTSGSNYSYGIYVDGDITVSGGEIVTNEKCYGYTSGITYGYNYALYTSLGDVTVTGGKITTNGHSGYLVNAGRSYSAVDQTVNISGVEFTNNLSEIDKTKGNHKEPALIKSNSAANITANITGGTFNGTSAELVSGSNCALTVSGGTFSTAPNAKYLAEELESKQNEDGSISYGEDAKSNIAKIGDTEYATLEEAFVKANDGETITLLDNATPTLISQRAITKAATIDLNGKTLTLTEDDLYFGTTIFKNGNIVVDPSVKPSTAVFWMFANQTLTFDNVKLTATGVTGTYLIGLDGNNADLNLLNSSEIIVENSTALDLDIICVNSSTGNDIVIDNSKVSVTNLDGRVFFRGNYTVSGNSDIDLKGITKAGFRIEAGQTLTIKDTATVDIEGEPRDGGIHLTDVSAIYNKEDSATVNATINRPAVAKIGDTEYATVTDALKAAAETGAAEVKILQSVKELLATDLEVIIKSDLTITADSAVIVDFYNNGTTYDLVVGGTNGEKLTIGENVTLTVSDRIIWVGYYGNNIDVIVNGGLVGGSQLWVGGDITVSETGTIASKGEALVARRGAKLTVNGGTFEANYFSLLSGTIELNNVTATTGPLWTSSGYSQEGSRNLILNNSNLTVKGNFKLYDGASVIVKDRSKLSFISSEYGPSILSEGCVLEVDTSSSVKTNAITGAGAINIDASEFDGTEVSVLTAGGMSGFTGNISVVNNGSADYEIGDDGTIKVIKKTVVDVAEINGVGYETLQAAIDAAIVDDTIKLLVPITVAAGETLTLNKDVTIDYTSDVLGTAMFTNNGTMIVDGTTITYKYTGEADPGYTKTNATIVNNGTLTVKNGIVENTTANMALASYAINNYAGATLNIEGGSVLNESAHAIRMVSFGTATNTVNISGGHIEGTRAIQFQLPGSSTSTTAPEMILNITGGELKSNESTYNLAVYVYSNGQNAANAKVDISGGIFEGNVAINAAANDSMSKGAVRITDGSFNCDYGVLSYASADTNNAISITGGSFKTNYAEQYATDDGYVFEQNAEGTYGVVEKAVEPEEPGIFGPKSLIVRYKDLVERNGVKKILITLFGGIDSLNYSEVGFRVTVNGVTKAFSTNTVYSKVKVMKDGKETYYNASDFEGNSKYIFGHSITLPATSDYADSEVIWQVYAKKNGKEILGGAFRNADLFPGTLSE